MGVSTWRLVARRIRTDRMMVAAAWLVVLASLTVLAAGVMYSDSVARSGLLRTLVDADPLDANVRVTAGVVAEDLEQVGAEVESVLNRTLAAAEPVVIREGRSDSYALPEQSGEEVRDLTTFAFSEGLEERATLVSGTWPVGGAEPLEASLSHPAAALLGLAAGDRLDVVSRIDRERTVTVSITGIYAVDDPSDAAWWRDPLLLEGTESSGSFTTTGPLMVSRDDLIDRTVARRITLTWSAFPDFRVIAPESAGAIRDGVRVLPDRLEAAGGPSASIVVDTALAAILSGAATSLLVNQTGVLLLNIQLAVLAGYALLLLAGLLAEQRRAETALYRSRGASPVQLTRMSVLEALVMVVPAVIAAPFIAVFVLGAAGAMGPLATIGLALQPRVTEGVWALVAVAGVAALLTLVLPVLASAGPLAGIRRSAGRQLGRALPQRLGLDVAFVVLAVLGLWQLNQYGSPLTRSLRGSLGADPLLVAAPALGLLAGAVLALRIVPLMARVLEWIVARRTGLIGSIGARQLSRRPLRYTRSALLLMVATAIGFFAGSYSGTWEQSQRDQVDYAVGADIRAVSSLPVTHPMWVAGATYGAIDGVEAAMPMVREDIDLGSAGGTGTLLATTPALMPSVVTFRPDLASTPLADLTRPLEGGTTELETIPLPAETRHIAMEVDAVLTPQAGEDPPARPIPGSWRGLTMGVVLRDGGGLIHRFEAAPTGFGEGRRASIPLWLETDDGERVDASGPFSLLAMEVLLRLPEGIVATGSFKLRALEASTSADGTDQQPVAFDSLAREGHWVRSLPLEAPVPVDEPGSLPAGVEFGASLPLAGPDEVRFALRPPSLDGPSQPLPALVSDRFLAVTATRIGDELAVGPRFAPARRITLVGRVTGFPSVHPDEPLVVVGLPAMTLDEYATRAAVPAFDEWWLSVRDDATDAVAAAVEAEPIAAASVSVASRETARRLADPIALGVIGALSLGAAAAALFGAIGFVVSAAVAARERLAEFALLRALGLSTRQLSTWLSLENAFLLLLSLGVGIALGAVLALVVLPTMALTADATVVVPAVTVTLPWHVLLALGTLSLLALAISTLTASRLLRRVGMGTVLRAGAE